MKTEDHYVLATNKSWNINIFNELQNNFHGNWHLVETPEQLSAEMLQRIHPRYIFFPHWSHYISADIFESYECIIFHMTDVPFGRGGSPLQNLIARKIYDTKISALKCVAELDAGPVYMKRPLSLHGSAGEIYIRAARIIKQMIMDIINNRVDPVPQEGDVVTFERRTPEQGDISQLDSLQTIFDWIRMLDAEGYPKAFLDVDRYRLEFERASLRQDCIKAEVTIKVRDND